MQHLVHKYTILNPGWSILQSGAVHKNDKKYTNSKQNTQISYQNDNSKKNIQMSSMILPASLVNICGKRHTTA